MLAGAGFVFGQQSLELKTPGGNDALMEIVKALYRLFPKNILLI